MTSKTGTRYLTTTQRYTTNYSGGFDTHNVYQPPTTSSNVVTQQYALPYSRVGGDRPRWREQMRSGADVSNSYSMKDMRLSTTPFKAEATFWVNPFWKPLGQYTYRISGELYAGIPALPGAMSAQATNQALNILIGRANDTLRSLQGGVVIGEIAETVHMVLRPASGVRRLFHDYLNDLRKGRRFRRRKDKRRYLRDTWLEYRLGLLPLVADTRGAAEALARVLNGTHPMHPISATGRDQQYIAATSGNLLTNGPLAVLYGTRTMDHFYAKGWAAMREESGESIATTFGVGLDQFIPTLWELIPGSFVADYFSNIGQIANTRFFNTGKFQYWGLSSRATRSSWAWTYGDATNKADPAYVSSSVSPGETVLEVVQFSRVPSAPLVPTLSVYTPRFPVQIANVAALLDGFRKITPL